MKHFLARIITVYLFEFHCSCTLYHLDLTKISHYLTHLSWRGLGLKSGANLQFFLGGGAPLRNGITDW